MSWHAMELEIELNKALAELSIEQHQVESLKASLWGAHYGLRKGMDESSKKMVKRDFFVQDLWLKWQECATICKDIP